MFDYSLEIISLSQILLDLGDEAMTGSLQIEGHPFLWLDGGNLILQSPWTSPAKLVPLFQLTSGTVKFVECDLSQELSSHSSKTLESCVFQAMRLILPREIEDKLPDIDTKLEITDDFRGTIEFNYIEQLIYDEIENQRTSCQALARKFKDKQLTLEQVRAIVYRLCALDFVTEVHELETVAVAGQIESNTPKPSIAQVVSNQMRLGLPIVGLVFLWLFNVLGDLELKTLNLLQNNLTFKETLNNIVTIEVEEKDFNSDKLAAAIDLVPDSATTAGVFPSTLSGSFQAKLDYTGFSDGISTSDDEGIYDASRLAGVDGVERMIIGREIDGSFSYSFWSKLALSRLKTLGVSPQWHNDKFSFSLSGTPVHPLSYGNVLYPRENFSGYQIIANPIADIPSISLNELLERPERQDLGSKIVIFGLANPDSQSSLASDLQFSASSVNQMLLTGTYGRKPLWVASRWLSIFLSFFFWALVLWVALKIRSSPHKQLKLLLMLLSIFIGYGASTLVGFLLGGWYGFSYPALASVLALCSSLVYKPKLAASYIDRESSLLSNKGFFDTISKLLELQFDNVQGSTLYLIGISNYEFVVDTIDSKKLVRDLLSIVRAVLQHFEIDDYTVGRLNSSRLGLLIPSLNYDNSCLIKGRFAQMFAKFTKQFKGISPKLNIGMAIFDGENYISPVELVATADSDSDYSVVLDA